MVGWCPVVMASYWIQNGCLVCRVIEIGKLKQLAQVIKYTAKEKQELF